ncbi:hypothetical protein RRG08_032368 [Elysia crispata]|uniref:Uncharacterized protein n=1 Tax=Elysia crispata TaxID=231223 RepID=A0AAE1DYH8_9GAST|nr:hypothetical protein RRG08_032368 [Elysia crispata]
MNLEQRGEILYSLVEPCHRWSSRLLVLRSGGEWDLARPNPREEESPVSVSTARRTSRNKSTRRSNSPGVNKRTARSPHQAAIGAVSAPPTGPVLTRGLRDPRTRQRLGQYQRLQQTRDWDSISASNSPGINQRTARSPHQAAIGTVSAPPTGPVLTRGLRDPRTRQRLGQYQRLQQARASNSPGINQRTARSPHQAAIGTVSAPPTVPVLTRGLRDPRTRQRLGQYQRLQQARDWDSISASNRPGINKRTARSPHQAAIGTVSAPPTGPVLTRGLQDPRTRQRLQQSRVSVTAQVSASVTPTVTVSPSLSPENLSYSVKPTSQTVGAFSVSLFSLSETSGQTGTFILSAMASPGVQHYCAMGVT